MCCSWNLKKAFSFLRLASSSVADFLMLSLSFTDEVGLSTTYEKCTTTAAAAAARTAAAAGRGAAKAAAESAAATMTKQLTTTTATNAASSITQTANLAPTVISPTAPAGAAATTTATATATTAATAATEADGTASALVEPTKTHGAQSTTITTTASSAAAAATAAEATTVSAAAAPPATSTALSDASGRSAALERAYVHDVYEHCEEPTGPVRPRVAQFLGNLEPGSVVCDVGCGSGRYLTQCNPAICTIGIDRCYRLSKEAHEKGGEVSAMKV